MVSHCLVTTVKNAVDPVAKPENGTSDTSANGNVDSLQDGVSSKQPTSSVQTPKGQGESSAVAPSTTDPKEAGMCISCSTSLPIMKRGLGRLESRLDSMVTMVRTIFLQQTGVVR